MSLESVTSADTAPLHPVVGDGGGGRAPHGIGPYHLAWRRLRRNRGAMVLGTIFVLVVVLCALAPVFARHVAHTGPNVNHLTDRVKVGGKTENVVSLSGVPIGPTWHGRFLLGADPNGRDIAVRLLYGGRNSLIIGFLATFFAIFWATVVGTLAGYFRGATDAVLSRLMDLIWAYPALLLGIALGTSLAIGGLNLGLFTLKGNSLLVPAFIIGIVGVPYVSKPLRAQTLALRDKEFVDAARLRGDGSVRIILKEIVPNLASTIIVFFPLVLAMSILLEAGLSYLGAGVQPPNASWGTMISDGIALLPGSVHLMVVPGVMLVLTVMGVNALGDGLRDALDPRAAIRGRR